MDNQENWRSGLLDTLRASRVFGRLDGVVLDDLVASLTPQLVVGGSLLLAEGEKADCLMIVVSGRLRVWRQDGQGGLLLYNEIGPGESIGETGLILEQPRYANVSALRDSTIAVLSRVAFEMLLKRHPLALNRVFAQSIHDFLRHTATVTNQPRASSFVIVPLAEGIDTESIAQALTDAFAQVGRAEWVSSRKQLGGNLHADNLENAIRRLDELEGRCDYLVYQAEAEASAWTRRVVRQADQVIFIADSQTPLAETDLERVLAQEPGFSLKRQHLLLAHPAAANFPDRVAEWRGSRKVERVYPVRIGDRQDFSRLVRFLTGTAVAVVLGGGGARGFAHIGALRALNEAGVAIDLVGGNSMGALIGAQFVCGVPLDDILQRTRQFALGGERPTLPAVSLLSGRRLERDLKRMFGQTNIENLWQPYFAAACNLTQACTTVQDSGLLWRAVLASNSPAGLLPPVVRDGDLLVDGAIFDNVPVSAMRGRLGTPLEQRRGNGTIIAVDVDVREGLVVPPDVGRLTAWGAIKGYFGSNSQRQPGIGDILYRAGHISGLHNRARTMALADLYLEPPVGDFALMAYRQAEEIASVGYRYTWEALEEWQQMQTAPL